VKLLQYLTGVSALLFAFTPTAFAADKPNILVIWGDDVGWSNVSAYGQSIMGYSTPNIDRLATEGIKFSDHYAQPSCTPPDARRSSPGSTRSARA
jgi:arylsulfatase